MMYFKSLIERFYVLDQLSIPMKTSLLFYGLIAFLFISAASCKKTGTVQTATSLKAAALFPYGAAIDPTLLRDNLTYRRLLMSEFASITVENMLKMNNVHPELDRFDYRRADEIVLFAQQAKLRVHGHTLVWHEAIPAWLKSFSGDSLAWEALFKTHIQTVAARYKGQLAGWDVVNEAIGNDGNTRNDNTDQGSIWRQKLGPDYVARAFQYAKQADPAVLLFYNDYGQESNPKKQAAILKMVAELRQRNIPIDGLGLQMHININTPDAGIRSVMEQYAQTGLLVHLSELDIALNPTNGPLAKPTEAQLAAQKQKYWMVVNTYRTVVPKAQQYGITQWNVSDADSWVRTYLKKNDFPLPFDLDYQRKPAYDGIMEALK